jgi:hypothetical protein
MRGCGVCTGILSRGSDVILAGLTALRAGECMSCLMPLGAAGDSAARVCAAGSGAMLAEIPRGPVKGFVDAAGVPAFAWRGRRGDLPFRPSFTCRCCRWSESPSTMMPGVAEPRAPGVLGSDPGLCRSLSLSCCLGSGAGIDMLSFSFGWCGSSTLALASARRL